jgi:hypothetical protein
MKSQGRGLGRKELQVYARRKNTPQAPPSDPIFPRPRPPLPSNDNIPPQPTLPRNDEIDLNIDMVGILTKVNIHVPLTEIINIPSIRNKVEIFLRVQGNLWILPYCYKQIILDELMKSIHLSSFLWC